VPYQFTEQGLAMQEDVKHFMDDHIYPNEEEYYSELDEVGHNGYPPILDKLKAAAK
jgi:acyl-CoA dehydrogenase